MYKCYDCDNLFDYFDTVKDYIGDYGDRRVYETIPICPYCNSMNFDEYHENEYEYEEEDEEND